VSAQGGKGDKGGADAKDGDLQQVEEACYVKHEFSIKPLLPPIFSFLLILPKLGVH